MAQAGFHMPRAAKEFLESYLQHRRGAQIRVVLVGMFSFPEVLYKGFPRREHAEAFCSGQVRFCTLEHYRETEDGVRSDQTEGIGVVHRNSEPGRPLRRMTQKVESTHAGIEKLKIEAREQEYFVCCFSMADRGGIDQLPERFGRYYVEVNSPRRLFYDLREAIQCDKVLGRDPPVLQAGAVRYDKGRYVGSLSDEREIRALPWLQKPAFYAEENEYRMHFRCAGDLSLSQPSYTLSMGRDLDYCRVLERENRR
jgi:hypothetical protein